MATKQCNGFLEATGTAVWLGAGLAVVVFAIWTVVLAWTSPGKIDRLDTRFDKEVAERWDDHTDIRKLQNDVADAFRMIENLRNSNQSK